MAENQSAESEALQAYRQDFSETASRAISALGERPFRLKTALNVAVYDAVMVGIAMNPEASDKVVRNGYEKLIKNDDFKRYTSRATSDETSVTERLKMAIRALAMPPEVRSYIDRVDALARVLLAQSGASEISLQPIYSNHLVLKASGLVELSAKAALSQYAAQRGNLQIQKFVESAVSRENALNCDKIRLLPTRMDKSWWPRIEET